MDKKKNITGIEWGIVIGGLIVSDLIQAGLDLIAIGLVVNRFLDVLIGFCFGFWQWYRGLADKKNILALAATFVGEEIPVGDVLPLWTLDGLFACWLYKSQKQPNTQEESWQEPEQA